MRIAFSPMRRDDRLTLERAGDVLIVNGAAVDFGALPEGGHLPADAIASDWFAGPVRRAGGVLRLTLVLPHAARAPQETRFPSAITVAGDGPVPVPPHAIEDPEEDA